MSKRRERSEDELRRLSRHLLYEIEMFSGTVGMLSVVGGMEPSETRTIMRNALLESWALHLRNLLSFLYDNCAGAGDAVALDFLGASWKKTRGPKSEVLRLAHAKASREMAHMAYLRAELRDDQREWHVAPIIADLVPVLQRFIDAVSPSLITDDFKQRALTAVPKRNISLLAHGLQVASGATAGLDAFRPQRAGSD